METKFSTYFAAFSLAGILSFWAIDAALDAFIFNRGLFSELLLPGLSSDELYSRLTAVAGFMVYGMIIIRIRESMDRKRMADEGSYACPGQIQTTIQKRTGKPDPVNDLLQKEIQDRKRTEDELSRSESFLNTILDSFYDPFCIVDRDYRIIRHNDAYKRIKHTRTEDLYLKKCYEILYERDSICDDCIVEKTFQSKDPCASEKMIPRQGEPDAWIEIFTYPIFDRNKAVSHVIQYGRDITDRKKAEEEKKQLIQKLNCLSTTDGLTGLLNRRALTEVLHREINRAIRYENELAVVLCDVDKFKEINDTFGHAAGDDALRVVAGALTGSLRRPDFLGRYGGDEFLIILPETPVAGAIKLAEKIRTAVSEIRIYPSGKREPVSLSLSIGVAGCCEPDYDVDELVKAADKALYKSKRDGRNRVSRA